MSLTSQSNLEEILWRRDEEMRADLEITEESCPILEAMAEYLGGRTLHKITNDSVSLMQLKSIYWHYIFLILTTDYELLAK